VRASDLPRAERAERLERLIDKRQKTVQILGFFDDGGCLLEAATVAFPRGRKGKAPAFRTLPEAGATRDCLR